jgi:phosphohistidine phosphatase SixA
LERALDKAAKHMGGHMLLLVRHADAGDKRDWDGPDLLRPLSPVGGRQAVGLVERLWDYPVEQILSSPAVRCHQTVQPLARDRYLRIESAPTLGVGVDPKQVLALFWDSVEVSLRGRRVGVKMGWVACRRRCVLGRLRP